ncbi:MAG: MFS transporter [Candidatus Aenigmarchaeota archaeon]|nr:MFS transporter [Candidatus Aenigmarchaeota archaeon]
MLSDIRKMYLFGFFRNFFLIGAISVPFFLEWGKLNYTQMFILQSWFSFWLFILEIPTGAIADRFGRKTSIVLGGFIASVGIFIYSLVPNFMLFLIAEFLAALGGALISGADRALIYDKLKQMKQVKQAKYVFSNYTIANTLGVIVALPLGSYIAGSMIWAHPSNYSFVMAYNSIPLFFSSIVALFVKEPKKSTKINENYFLIAKKGLEYFINHKILRTLALDLILISAMTFYIYWLYQPLLKNVGVDVKYFGFVGAAFNIFEIILLRNLKFIEKHFNNRNIIFLTAAIPGLMYVLLGFFQNIILLIFGLLLIVGFKELRRPIFEHYINKLIPNKQRATILSSISMLERMVIAVVYPIVGILTDYSLNFALIILGTLTLVLTFLSRVTKEMFDG